MCDMSSIQIATVGRSPQPVVEGFLFYNSDRLFLLHSKETVSQARQITARLESLLEEDITRLCLVDPFDLTDIIGNIVRIVRAFRQSAESKLLINITGGTNVMASAALLASIIVDAVPFYIKEGKGKPVSIEGRLVRLPVPKIRSTEINAPQQRIIHFLSESGGKLTNANTAISRQMNIKPQLTSYHIRRLNHYGLIEVSSEGRGKTIELTVEGRLYSQIFQE